MWLSCTIHISNTGLRCRCYGVLYGRYSGNTPPAAVSFTLATRDAQAKRSCARPRKVSMCSPSGLWSLCSSSAGTGLRLPAIRCVPINCKCLVFFVNYNYVSGPYAEPVPVVAMSCLLEGIRTFMFTGGVIWIYIHMYAWAFKSTFSRDFILLCLPLLFPPLRLLMVFSDPSDFALVKISLPCRRKSIAE